MSIASFVRERMKGRVTVNQLQIKLAEFTQCESGSAMPFPVLVFIGALLASVYSFDTSRMIDSASQLKRATDAAAMAVGYTELASSNTGKNSDLTTLARNYIGQNLGLDSGLAEQVDLSTVRVQKGETSDGAVTYKVSVTTSFEAPELGTKVEDKTIFSTVEVMSRPTEVAMMLPNTITETGSDIAALKRIGKQFAKDFINTSNDQNLDDVKRWMSLIPYSQSVNVYDAADSGRLTRWAAPGALNPSELRSLFRTGKVNSLADERFPDRAANLLCLYRGLGRGENFFWDQPPSGQFNVYYRHDLPENGSPGAPPISWQGPNPDFPDTLAIDTRWIVADRGCPNAPLLPLTNETEKVDERLDQMSTRFNVNYTIALSWAAATLSPQMRGSNGWGDNELPLDFGSDNSNYKAIIMLANTTGDWFDTDSYNYYPNRPDSTSGVEQRFVDLCRSIRSKNIHVYFIGVRPGDPTEFGRVLFDKVAGPGMLICTEGAGNMYFANATNFAEGESQIKSALEDIAKDIRRNYYVRLIN
ncbi:Tad domain-containing protein [Vibrio porteresiae]|uniref:Tad domain-containing protein n=1 Tax=Vibrio porteresiae DSM 19223 TaxID=1123496 RepID=A0ABZ0QGN7_9VIBR|nr:Tad domain-containing protein [Vibrio porteresiae]WPC75669.1 Tad domain-containing protein [Vibrio porteresiae DSM 19223]